MSEPSTQAQPDQDAPDTEPSPSASDAALARYRAAQKRPRIVYAAVVGLLVVAAVVVSLVAYARGEVSHASLRTHAPAPPSLPVQAASPTLTQAWRSGDRVALGTPQWGGTVITFSAHTVGGRDARTGARTWTYTRSDRTLCTAAQLTGTTVAVYAVHGNCDELSAFDSDTGRRRWTRTLDMDGQPLDGRPLVQVTPYTVLLASPDVIYALDPVTGYNRWTYSRYGCRVQQVALGSAGALIGQTCSSAVRCTNIKYCGRGPQLLLRDGSAGRSDDAKPNADQMKWIRLGDASIPAAADQVIASVDPAGNRIVLHDEKSGAERSSVPLRAGAAPATAPVSSFASTSTELIWVSGGLYAVLPDATRASWSAATVAPPTVVSTTGEDPPTLATARIAVPTGSGIALLDGNDGRTAQSFTVPPAGAGGRVFSLGSGFLVTDARGVVAYR